MEWASDTAIDVPSAPHVSKSTRAVQYIEYTVLSEPAHLLCSSTDDFKANLIVQS